MASGDPRNGDDLSSIAAALGDLADRIDDADRNRPGRRGEPGDRSSLDRLAAMVDDLGRELDEADKTISSRIASVRRPASLQRRPEANQARLGDLNVALHELERHVSTLAAPASRPSEGAEIDRLNEIRNRLEALRVPQATRGLDDPEADRLESLERRLSGTVSRFAGATQPPRANALGAAPSRPRDLDAAIAEISARQMELGEPGAARNAIPRMPPRGATGAQAEQLAQIGARLEELTRKIGSAPKAGPAPRQARFAEDDLKSLADRIASLSSVRPDDSRRFDQLRTGLDDMRRSVEETARESTLRSIEAGYGHIVERLDEMMRRVPDTSRLDRLTHEVAELRNSLREPDAGRNVERLERRLDVLIGEFRKSTAAPAPDFTEWFGHFEGRLAEISRSLAESQAREPTVGPDAVERLEAQLESVIRRIDDLAAGQDRPVPSIDALAVEIADFRAEIAAHSRHEIERLELQIQELAERVSNVHATAEDHAALRQLEAEVKLLAAKLETGGQRPAAFAKIEDSLAQLQAMLAESRRESIAAAREAARDAIGQYAASNSGDSDIVRRLKHELGELQAAAVDSDHRTQEALEAVHDTLKRVVERIADLEIDPGADDEPLDLRPTGTEGAGPGPSDAPVKHAAGWWTSAAATSAEDHRPLEPGSGKPHIGASSVGIAEPRAATADRKADFIAAARRAAQAAAAESSDADNPLAGDGRPGPLSRISQVLRNRKRPLVLLAAALVLTAGVYQVHEPALRLATDIAAKARATAVGGSPAALPPAIAMTAPAEPDPIREVVSEAGRLLPDELQQPQAAAPGPSAETPAETAFAAPAGVASQFGATSSGPSSSSFAEVQQSPLSAIASETAPAGTDPTTTASIAPASEAAGLAVPTLLAPESPAATAPQPAPVEAAATAAPQVAALSPAPEAAKMAPAGDAALPLPQVGPDALRKAAAAGNPAAQFEIAAHYAEGRGVAQDLAEAALWYERAATRGLAPAQYRLGSLYERGVGVTRDRTLAQLWYSKAAEQGNARAMHNLAVLMSEGVDGSANHRQALEWFKQAANYDVRDSQYNLGVIYARGLGTSQDLAESYKWFAIAAAGGDADAGGRRDEVAAVAEPVQLAAAKARVEAWKPTPLVVAANDVPVPAESWREAAPPAIPQPAASTAPTAAETVQSELIRQAQALLVKHGFDPGPPDGFDGPRTRDAVKEFQRLSGHAETGIIDAALVEALGRAAL